jgi:hypothetical protein
MEHCCGPEREVSAPCRRSGGAHPPAPPELEPGCGGCRPAPQRHTDAMPDQLARRRPAALHRRSVEYHVLWCRHGRRPLRHQALTKPTGGADQVGSTGRFAYAIPETVSRLDRAWCPRRRVGKRVHAARHGPGHRVGFVDERRLLSPHQRTSVLGLNPAPGAAAPGAPGAGLPPTASPPSWAAPLATPRLSAPTCTGSPSSSEPATAKNSSASQPRDHQSRLGGPCA